MIRGLAIVIGVSAALFSPCARAHPSLSEYVQHDVTLRAGATYIDVTVHLTFFDRFAELQHVLADSDGDGQLSGSELAAFRKDLLAAAETQLQLRAGGAPLDLVPLFDPEIQARATGEGTPGQLEIQLHFFARTPDAARCGTRLEIRDALFPESPALAGFHVIGRGAVRLTATSETHDLTRPAGPDHALVLEAQLHPPAAPDAAETGTTTSRSISDHEGDTP